jgi:hypothetical protein
MMKAKQSRIRLADVEPALATLETAEIAPQFELKCGADRVPAARQAYLRRSKRRSPFVE